MKSLEFIANHQKKLICKRGHLRTSENLYSRGTCKICVKATVKAYQQSHRQWVSERGRVWRNTTKGKRVVKNNELKRYHGISLLRYEELLAEQNGKCAICKEFPRKRMLAVDHNHGTSRIRGLLCHTCNTMIVPTVEYHRHLIQSTKDYLNEESEKFRN